MRISYFTPEPLVANVAQSRTGVRRTRIESCPVDAVHWQETSRETPWPKNKLAGESPNVSFSDLGRQVRSEDSCTLLHRQWHQQLLFGMLRLDPETVLVLLTTTRIPGRIYRTGTVVGPCSVDDLHSCAVTSTVTTEPLFFLSSI